MTGNPVTEDQAVAAAGRFLAINRIELAEKYRRGGAMAVARKVTPKGTPEQQEATAAYYERLREQTIKRLRERASGGMPAA